MSKSKMAQLMRVAKTSITKHSPEILTGIGIAGMITTTVLAVKATPKAIRLVEEAKEEKGEDLTKAETIKICWKAYIPAAAICVTSTACLIGASSVSIRRNAMLATAYKLSETAFSEYKEKVVETIGDEKEKIVREKVSEERIKKNPITKNEIIMTDYGDTQFYETLSGRYFKSDIEQIKKVVNYLNKDMLQDMFGTISLNEFYDELELERIDLGDELGWRVDKGLIEIDFTSKIADNGKPCIVLDYINAPHYGFDKFN